MTSNLNIKKLQAEVLRRGQLLVAAKVELVRLQTMLSRGRVENHAKTEPGKSISRHLEKNKCGLQVQSQRVNDSCAVAVTCCWLEALKSRSPTSGSVAMMSDNQ